MNGESRNSCWGRQPSCGGHQCPTQVLFGKMYAKTKELGPVEGVSQGCPLDQPLVMPVLYAQ